jgi:hypothetical protein
MKPWGLVLGSGKSSEDEVSGDDTMWSFLFVVFLWLLWVYQRKQRNQLGD